MPTITYNANGGTGAPAQQTFTGTSVTLSTVVPTFGLMDATKKSNITYNGNGGTPSKTTDGAFWQRPCTFLGWATSSNASVATYQSGQTITVSSDIILYAVWQDPTSSTVSVAPTFTAPTATKSSTTQTYTAQFSATGTGVSCNTSSLTATAIISYKCSGWYTAASGGTFWATAGTTYTPKTAGTITLYAHWSSTYNYGTITLPTATKSNTYTYRTVTINANGGSSSVTSRSSSCTTRYTFSGWYTAASGGTKVGNGGATLTLSFDRTLYAQFASTVGSYSSVVLPTASQCARSGYKLLGFSKSNTATTATYAPGATYTPSATETLYAVWAPEGALRIGSNVYTPYVYYNGTWTQVIPHAYVNGEWKQGG